MSAQLYFGSKTIAYASLNLGDKDFDAIGDYCLNQSFEVDIFAEETGSLESNRPILNQVIELVEKQKVKVLVIPSIDHILCSRFTKPTEFLNYLRRHGVWLHSLADEAKSQVIH